MPEAVAEAGAEAEAGDRRQRPTPKRVLLAGPQALPLQFTNSVFKPVKTPCASVVTVEDLTLPPGMAGGVLWHARHHQRLDAAPQHSLVETSCARVVTPVESSRKELSIAGSKSLSPFLARQSDDAGSPSSSVGEDGRPPRRVASLKRWGRRRPPRRNSCKTGPRRPDAPVGTLRRSSQSPGTRHELEEARKKREWERERGSEEAEAVVSRREKEEEEKGSEEAEASVSGWERRRERLGRGRSLCEPLGGEEEKGSEEARSLCEPLGGEEAPERESGGERGSEEEVKPLCEPLGEKRGSQTSL